MQLATRQGVGLRQQRIMLFDIAPLKEALEQGDTVLTPNRRLASAVRESWGLSRRQAGHGAWRVPPVHALDDWLAMQWRELVFSGSKDACARRLLSEAEEHWVWERIIQDSRQGHLLRSGEAARQGAKAWHTFLHWQCGEAEKERFRGIDDCEAFLEWSAAFSRECNKKGWFSVADRDLKLHTAFRDGLLSILPRLVLLNFKEETLSPLQRALLEAAATELQRVQPVSKAGGSAFRLACEDADTELYAAARWAHALLVRDAAATVGVVVPNLTARRRRVERIFLEVFDPGALLPDSSEEGAPFNISAGEPLARAPVPAAMLRLLRLFSHGLSPAEFRDLLCCPFLNFCEESARSRLCGRLEEWPDISLSARYLLRHLQKADAAAATRMAAALEEMPQKGSARQWCSFWRRQMDAWDCSGTGLSSTEYRGWRRWQGLLDEFADGSEVYGPMRAKDAFAQLTRLAESTMSQPLGEGARLHILEQLEVNGLSFSGLWLSGMGDRDWPSPAEPSPLLPIALQRERSMPRADADRELAYAKALTQGFLASALQVVCSYPLREGDQILGRPSALVAHLPKTELAALEATAGEGELSAWRDRLRQSLSLETAEAGEAIPPPDEDSRGGGTSLLKDQSACPFRASARHRWRIRATEQRAPGLSPLEQGSLAHNAMERLWASLEGDSTALENRERCQRAVEEAAAGAVEEMASDLQGQPVSPGRRFWQAEKNRLERLLHLWLKEEQNLASESPFRVASAEKGERFELGELVLSLRPDRVDELPGGGCRIVDYKTGKKTGLLGSVRTGDWGGEFPREPQLPLYALAVTEAAGAGGGAKELKGIAYGALNSEDMGYVWGDQNKEKAGGAMRPGEHPPPDADSWPRQLKKWRESLGKLVQEYMAGQSEVRPRVQGACSYCDLGPLCRVPPDKRR